MGLEGIRWAGNTVPSGTYETYEVGDTGSLLLRKSDLSEIQLKYEQHYTGITQSGMPGGRMPWA